jgi:hypothetical protein
MPASYQNLKKSQNSGRFCNSPATAGRCRRYGRRTCAVRKISRSGSEPGWELEPAPRLSRRSLRNRRSTVRPARFRRSCRPGSRLSKSVQWLLRNQLDDGSVVYAHARFQSSPTRSRAGSHMAGTNSHPMVLRVGPPWRFYLPFQMLPNWFALGALLLRAASDRIRV